MHTAIKISSIILRCLELFSAVIVAGIVGFFIHRVHQAPHGDQSARVLYAEAAAAIGIVVSLVLLPPMAYAFSIFAAIIDFVMFVMWIVAFGVLADLNINNTCTSDWFQQYWGFYWNRWWQHEATRSRFTQNGCSQWDSVLAFCFISFICFLASMCLGLWTWYSRKNELVQPEGPITSQTKRRSFSSWIHKEKRTSNESASTDAPVAQV